MLILTARHCLIGLTNDFIIDIIYFYYAERKRLVPCSMAKSIAFPHDPRLLLAVRPVRMPWAFQGAAPRARTP